MCTNLYRCECTHLKINKLNLKFKTTGNHVSRQMDIAFKTVVLVMFKQQKDHEIFGRQPELIHKNQMQILRLKMVLNKTKQSMKE